MEKTIVIGGSGFIGKAIQSLVSEQGLDQSFVFSYCATPENVSETLEKVKIDLLRRVDVEAVEGFPTAIYVAGNADHSLARNSPSADLDLNVKMFLHFVERFRGSLVLLSSQATYYGLEGEINENADHVSTIPYGLSKQMVEAYAKYFQRIGLLHRLWIFRLMYAFGKGEKERRLIPRCADAVKKGGKVTVSGEGKSFVNPLPSWFVAHILTKAVESVGQENAGFLEVTNLNCRETVTVGDVVAFLNSVKHFDYSHSEGGEEWPIMFWGNTERLASYLKKSRIEWPNVWEELRRYFVELTKKVA